MKGMITETRQCEECGSENIVRNGKNRAGSQRYKCNDCGVTRVLDSQLASRQVDLAAVERAYLERNSLRGTARIFKVSHTTISDWLKKSPTVSPLQGEHRPRPQR